jgi:hypothetical protein
MSDGKYVLDNTGDLSSLFEGSITNEGSAATMPMLTMEPNSGVDDAAGNQQDWQEFDGDINDLLSSQPPTYLRLILEHLRLSFIAAAACHAFMWLASKEATLSALMGPGGCYITS